MSRFLSAVCSADGEVSVGGLIEEVTILSAGQQQSSGILLMQGDKMFYVTSNATDIATLISKVSDLCAQAASGLNSAGGALNGIAPGSGAGAVTAATQINAIKSDLDQLKGMLK